MDKCYRVCTAPLEIVQFTMLEEVVESRQRGLSVVDENFIINCTVCQGYQCVSMLPM